MPEITADAVDLFDSDVLATARCILDIPDGENVLGPTSYAQLTLPLAQGGFALPQFRHLRELAYLSSLELFGPVPVANANSQRERTAKYWECVRTDLMTDMDLTHQARLHSFAPGRAAGSCTARTLPPPSSGASQRSCDYVPKS